MPLAETKTQTSGGLFFYGDVDKHPVFMSKLKESKSNLQGEGL